MTYPVTVVALKGVLALPLIAVSFLINGQGPTSSPRPIQLAPGPGAYQNIEKPTPLVLPIRRFSDARGFGKGVPLAFAVQQIVPVGVAVSFGPGVAADTLVDWVGGRPWNRVLQAAVAPHGLHVATGRLSVRIDSD